MPLISDYFQKCSLLLSICLYFLYPLWDRLHCYYHASVAEVPICKHMLVLNHPGTCILCLPCMRTCVQGWEGDAWLAPWGKNHAAKLCQGVHLPVDSLGDFKLWLPYSRPRAKAPVYFSCLFQLGNSLYGKFCMEKLRKFLPKSYGKIFCQALGCAQGPGFHSWLLFTLKNSFYLPSFHPGNVSIFLTFLSVSLPKIRQPLSLSLTSSMVLSFSISYLFFFPLCDFFLENVACSECLLMLERNIGQNKNWT